MILNGVNRFVLLLCCFLFPVADSWSALESGTKLPEFTLESINGESVSLADYKGKIVLVHLWKCQWNQCRAEIPHLIEIKKQYDPEQVQILSINVLNRKGRTEAEVIEYNMDYLVLLGRGAYLTKTYEIAKLPHLFILDEQGIIKSSERFLKAEEIKVILDNMLTKANNQQDGEVHE